MSNSGKLSHVLWGHPRQVDMVERSDTKWSTGEGNGKPLQYSCVENPMNSMKRQNDKWFNQLQLKGRNIKINLGKKNIFLRKPTLSKMSYTSWETSGLTFLRKYSNSKEESEQVGLKLNIQKTKIMASGPTTSWQIDGETVETVETVADFIFFWTPKSLQMVIAAIKLKDIYSLEGKLWPT